MMLAASGLYAVTAFFLARRQFIGLQDTAWTGGVISLGGGRAVAEQTGSGETTPWRALFLKELETARVHAAGIAALFVVHLGAPLLRKAGAACFRQRNARRAGDVRRGGRLIVPLLAGCQSVAEERQLGILDGLLCLPFSRRAQYCIKLFFVIVLGGLVSPVLLCFAERIGNAIGAGANLGVMGITFEWPGVIRLVYIFFALSLFGFYGSTLTRSVVQALAAGVVVTFVSCGLMGVANALPYVFGLRLWPVMALPTLGVAIIWLAYGNFRWLFESGRRWRRNILGLTTVTVLIFSSAAAIYHRAWEWVIPLEDAHGPARLPAGKPVVLRIQGGDGLAAVLPDGRLWVDRLVYGWRTTLSGGYFAPGSNWVDAIALFEDIVIF